MDGAITIDVTGLHSFLLALLAIGVPVLELIRIEPVLSISGGLTVSVFDGCCWSCPAAVAFQVPIT